VHQSVLKVKCDGKFFFPYSLVTSPECLHLVVVVELASLNDLRGYAGGNIMFLVGPPKPDRP
jgi:hypothetical protein